MFVLQSRSSGLYIHCERVMSKNVKPHATERAKLKRLVRHLKRERQWRQVFSYRRMVEEVTTFSDSDWAGCQETRKSSSASVILLGSHTLKAYPRKQKIIARSSAEAELHAAALGASESKGIVSLLKDLVIRCSQCWPLMRRPPITSSTDKELVD